MLHFPGNLMPIEGFSEKKRGRDLSLKKKFLTQNPRVHCFGSENIPTQDILRRNLIVKIRTPESDTAACTSVAASNIRNWFGHI